MRTAFIVSALAFVVPALGAPTLIPIVKRDGPVKPNSYIIQFKDNASKQSALSKLAEKLKSNLPGSSQMTYDYGSLFPAIAAVISPQDLDFVRSMPGISQIEPDSILTLIDYVPNNAIDLAPPTAAEHSPLVHRGEDGPQGKGVTVYGIDTGIYVKHNCFGGRARWGKTFGDGYKDEDGNGHGTHTAATAVCGEYRGAAKANVVAVKGKSSILGDDGSGSMSNVLAGVQYASDQHKALGGPSIATMSLGGPGLPNSALNKGIEEAINAGVHFTVAAGNSNEPADLTSPANTKTANTIGAANTTDHKTEKASFSNFGEYLDVWAPGVNILSAWIKGPDSTAILSGTSMATPYVAGVLATVLSRCPKLTPAVLSQQLKDNAVDSVTFADPITDMLASTTSTHKFVKLWPGECKSETYN